MTALVQALTTTTTAYDDDDDKHRSFNNDLHMYSPADGLLEMREALRHKVARDNGLLHANIMIMAGASQEYSQLCPDAFDSWPRGCAGVNKFLKQQ